MINGYAYERNAWASLRIKAVAEGSISYYVDHYVTSRVAKSSYVIDVSLSFDPDDTEHLKRSVSTWPSGDKKVVGGLDVILRQVAETFSKALDFLCINQLGFVGNGRQRRD